MNDDHQRLLEARDLIKQKKFAEARAVLLTVEHHPKAQEWLQKLDQLAPAPPPSPKPSPATPPRPATTEQADDVDDDFFSADPLRGVQAPPEARAANDPDSILQEARALIKADRIDEAREKLLLIADHPKAQNWLMRLGSIGGPAQQVAQQEDNRRTRRQAQQASPSNRPAGSSRRLLRIVVLLLIVVLIAAALVALMGGDDEGDDSADDAQEADQATLDEEEDATPQAAIATLDPASFSLSQTYSTDDETLIISYPANIQLQEGANEAATGITSLRFATSEAALDALLAGETPSEGEYALLVFIGPGAAQAADGLLEATIQAQAAEGEVLEEIETDSHDDLSYRRALLEVGEVEQLFIETTPLAETAVVLSMIGEAGFPTQYEDVLLNMARTICVEGVCAPAVPADDAEG